mmetsp:Transcript_91944/g.297432  ORF Transcript_91944/g.297432 Transcript_91944/m.297432 type:complete len:276 (-) Transcript_91944:1121-1948(-)
MGEAEVGGGDGINVIDEASCIGGPGRCCCRRWRRQRQRHYGGLCGATGAAPGGKGGLRQRRGRAGLFGGGGLAVGPREAQVGNRVARRGARATPPRCRRAGRAVPEDHPGARRREGDGEVGAEGSHEEQELPQGESAQVGQEDAGMHSRLAGAKAIRLGHQQGISCRSRLRILAAGPATGSVEGAQAHGARPEVSGRAPRTGHHPTPGVLAWNARTSSGSCALGVQLHAPGLFANGLGRYSDLCLAQVPLHPAEVPRSDLYADEGDELTSVHGNG